MFIVAIYDTLAKKFIQFLPTASVDVLKRDLKNTVKMPNHIFATNSEDFDVYQLCEIDDTGICLPKKELLFNMKELKDDPQVL